MSGKSTEDAAGGGSDDAVVSGPDRSAAPAPQAGAEVPAASSTASGDAPQAAGPEATAADGPDPDEAQTAAREQVAQIDVASLSAVSDDLRRSLGLSGDTALSELRASRSDKVKADPPGPVQEWGRSPALTLVRPFAVTIDRQGRVLVMDRPERDLYRVACFEPDGSFMRVMLTCGKGSGEHELKFPKSIAVDSHGNLYVADSGNRRVQRFDARGSPLGPIGSSVQGLTDFEYPCGLAVDFTGSLFVADSGRGRVTKITPQGVPLLYVGDGADTAGDSLEEPVSIAVDRQGGIAVLDAARRAVIGYDQDGARRFTWGHATGLVLEDPREIHIDASGAIYVVDQAQSRLSRLDASGKASAAFAVPGEGEGGGTALCSDGAVLVCQPSRNAIVRVDFSVGD